VVVALAGMFELYLYQVGGIGISWYVGQPVVGVQLTILSTYGMLAQSAVATSHNHEFFLHIFRFFLISE
jgi:hypothetical protein